MTPPGKRAATEPVLADRGALRVVIVVLAALVVAAFWTAAVVLGRHDLARTLSELDDENRHLARTLAEHAARTIDYADRLALEVKAQHEKHGRGFALERYGREAGINRSIVPGIVIADARGEVRQMDAPLTPAANIGDRAHFSVHAATDSGRPFVSPPVFSRVQERYNIIVSRRLNRPDGTFDGVVGVAIDPDSFTGFYRDIGLGENGLIALTGLDGFVRARNAGDAAGIGQDVRGGALFKEYAKREEGTGRFESVINGVARRVAFRRLEHYPLVLAVGVAEQTVLAEVSGRVRILYFGALVASVLALCAAAALLWLLRRQDNDAQALAESSARFRQVTENIGDVFWLTDPAKAQLLYASPAYEKIWGRRLAEVYRSGLAWVEGIHAEDRERVMHAARTRQAQGDYDEQYRVVRPDGSLRWIRDRAFPVRNAAGAVVRIAGVAEDITDVRELERTYRHMVEASPDATFINRDDFIVYANPAALKMLRANSAEDVVGKSPLAIVHPDDRAAVGARIARQRAGEEMAGLFEQRFIAFDGSVIDAEVSIALTLDQGQVSRQVVARDITQRKKTAAALRGSEARYRRLVEESPDATFITRGETVVYANPAALRLLGAETPGQIVGGSVMRYVHPAHADAARARIALMDSGASYNPSEVYERQYVRFDGSVVDVELSSARIELADGVGRQVVARDVSARKRAEAALRDSEARYRILVETSPDAIFIYRDDAVEYVNLAGVGMLGAPSAAAILGRSMFEFIDATGHAAALARRAHMKSAGRPTGLFEQTYVRLDGGLVEVEGSALPLAGAGGAQRMVVLRDVSARKRAEAALRESETRLRLAVEAAGLTDWEWDVASDQTHWGHQHERLLGPLPEGAGRYPDFREMVHADDRARFLAAGRATLEHGAPYDIEFRFVRADGEVRWLRNLGRAVRDAQGRVERLVGVTQDVTRRHEFERELAESQQRRDALLESNPDPSWLKDRDGRYIAANRAWFARHGIAPHNIAGKTDADIFDAGFAALIGAEDRRVVETRALVRGERNRKFADGVEWIETVKTPVFDGAGRVVAVAGVSHDITERKRAEQAAREMNESLAQKTIELTALNQELEAFSYSVSHDLRAPLRSISGFGSFLLKDSHEQLDAAGRGRLQRILAAAERMGQLIDDLLTLARISRQPMLLHDVNLHALAGEIMAGYKAEDPARRVEFIAATGLTVKGDAGLMRVMLDNLLGNAWKFTGRRAQARIEIGSALIDGVRTIFVRDDGAGFDMTYAGKLFAPFQRMHSQEQFEGTGVGLATVKRIVERHHGKIWIESAPERGTTVFFTLGESR